MEPSEENGEELIDSQGRNVTQQRIDDERATEAESEQAVSEPDDESFDRADRDTPPS